MSEYAEQVKIITFAKDNQGAFPELKYLFHIPNGGSRDIITASRLKRCGVRKGVPDLCLPVKNKYYGSLWVELKDGKGKKQTKEQIEYENFLKSQGCQYVVCYSGEEAIAIIRNYLEAR